jgi:predicted RNA-binding Zn-ribbon protein involved in translation (DUF1610 family)
MCPECGGSLKVLDSRKVGVVKVECMRCGWRGLWCINDVA